MAIFILHVSPANRTTETHRKICRQTTKTTRGDYHTDVNQESQGHLTWIPDMRIRTVFRLS